MSSSFFGTGSRLRQLGQGLIRRGISDSQGADYEAAADRVAIPQEQSIPGLPAPSGGQGVQRYSPALLAGREVMTRRSGEGATPSGVVLPGKPEVARKEGTFADYQLAGAPQKGERRSVNYAPGQEWRAGSRPKSPSLLDEVMERGGEPLLQQLKTLSSPANRPFEGPLVTAVDGRRGEKIFLDREFDPDNSDQPDGADPSGQKRPYKNPELGVQPGQRSPKYGILPQSQGLAPKEAPKQRVIEGGPSDRVNTWTDSNSKAVRGAVKMPYVDEAGNLFLREVHPGSVIETVDRGTERRTRFADSQVRVTEDNGDFAGKMVNPDDTLTANTRVEMTIGEKVRDIYNRNRTPVATAEALNERLKQGYTFTPAQNQGTLKGTLERIDAQGNRTSLKVYDPELGENGRPLTTRQEVPDGLYGVKNQSTKIYRVGSPNTHNYDNILKELAEERVLPTLAPEPSRPVNQTYPAYLDQLESGRGQTLVPGDDGSLIPGSWREAANRAWQSGTESPIAFVSSGPNAPAQPLLVRRGKSGSPELHFGTPVAVGRLTPAILSPDKDLRFKAENMSDKPGTTGNYKVDPILQELIAAGGDRAMEIGSGVGPTLLENFMRRQVANRGVDRELVEDALVQSAKTLSGWEETSQAIRQASDKRREVDLFSMDENSIGDPSTAAKERILAIAETLPDGLDPVTLETIAPTGSYERDILDAILSDRQGGVPFGSADPRNAGDIALWQRGTVERGVNPRAVADFNRWANSPVDEFRGDIPEITDQLLAEAAEKADQRFEEDLTYSPAGEGSYEAGQSRYGNYGDGKSQAINTVKDALRPMEVEPDQVLDVAKHYARVLSGASGIDGQIYDPAAVARADKIAELVVEKSQDDVEGRQARARTIYGNLEKVIGFDLTDLEYAVNMTGSSNFKQLADLLDVAQRGGGADPLARLNQIEQLAGGLVLSGTPMTGGRRVAANRVTAPYQAPIEEGDYQANYPRLGDALGSELGSSAQTAAANFLAERIAKRLALT
jgi:hypothetical protein